MECGTGSGFYLFCAPQNFLWLFQLAAIIAVVAIARYCIWRDK